MSEMEAAAAEIDLLTSMDKYLAAGCHIGTQVRTKDMEEFVYRQRPIGLHVLDIRKTDERIRTAAKFIARFEPERVFVVSGRVYGKRPIQSFSHYTGATPLTDRFVPGTFTNTFISGVEPELVILTDPRTDLQALLEAAKIGVPVIALCDTDNVTTGIDFIIPSNNRGRKALALIYFLVARQVLRERGVIGLEDEVSFTVEDFEPQVQRF